MILPCRVAKVVHCARRIIQAIVSVGWFCGATALHAAASPAPRARAIVVPTQQQWIWVDFSNAFCGDGTPTGLGVNFNKPSSRVLIYLEGGGACWSGVTCYVQPSAANFNTGYHAANFEAESTSRSFLAQPGGFFDRAAANNPFKNDNYVFIPYCTGDLHAGNNVIAYDAAHTAHHVGYANMTAYLQRIVATFPAATRVTLVGSSAGGYGALFNWDQTQRAFGSVRVDMIDDSGTPIPPDVFAPSNPNFQAQVANWALHSTLPVDCAACYNGFTALLRYYASAYPNDKGAYLTYQNDAALPGYYGITPSQFLLAIGTDATLIRDTGNQRYFAAGGAGHMLFFNPTLKVGATSLQSWLAEMTTDNANWSNVSP